MRKFIINNNKIYHFHHNCFDMHFGRQHFHKFSDTFTKFFLSIKVYLYNKDNVLIQKHTLPVQSFTIIFTLFQKLTVVDCIIFNKCLVQGKMGFKSNCANTFLNML